MTDQQRDEIRQLRAEVADMRRAQTEAQLALASRLATIEAQQAQLLAWKDSANANTWKGIGVILAAFLGLIIATVFPGGLDK